MSTTCDGRGTVLVRERVAWRVGLDTRSEILGLDVVGGSVWATGPSSVIEPRIWRERGYAWRRAKAPSAPGVITAMAGTATDDRWVVGASPSSSVQPTWFVAHWDGSAWTMSPPPSGTVVPILHDVVVGGAGRPWTVGGETNGCPHPNCGDRPLLVRGPAPPS